MSTGGDPPDVGDVYDLGVRPDEPVAPGKVKITGPGVAWPTTPSRAKITKDGVLQQTNAKHVPLRVTTGLTDDLAGWCATCVYVLADANGTPVSPFDTTVEQPRIMCVAISLTANAPMELHSATRSKALRALRLPMIDEVARQRALAWGPRSPRGGVRPVRLDGDRDALAPQTSTSSCGSYE